MFAIDLLQGKEKPPGSHPVVVAAVTLVFLILVVGALLDGLRYLADGWALAAERQTLTHYRKEVAGLSGVAKMLDASEKRLKEIDASLAEVSTALASHAKWSSILVAVTQSAPESITVTDLMAKREERKDKQSKISYAYSLLMGIISPSGPAAVEEFVRTLRQAAPLASTPDSIRIISQRQQQVEGRDFQYYVIECRLKP